MTNDTDTLPLTDAWAAAFDLPEPGNMMERHDRREAVFVAQGTQMATAIRDAIVAFTGRPLRDQTVLDFGCGVGRVALPLYHFCGKPDHCVDVDPRSIRYLQSQIPGARPQVTAFEPPLPFADASFDVVFSVSVWTHLDAAAADAWLTEMVRILRPGGFAFLTTSNYRALAQRRAYPPLARLGWDAITDEVLRARGYVFIETPPAPGTGHYGLASHDPEFIRRDWARHMHVIDILPGAIQGTQDINVLQKPAAT